MHEVERVETPEHVDLYLPLAGIGSRFAAGVIDYSIMVGVALVLAVVAFASRVTSPTKVLQELQHDLWLSAVLGVVVFALQWGYFGLFEYFWQGQTPGKRWVRIRVVREGGGALGLVDVAIRNLLRVVDALAAYLVGGASMFVSSKVQRLGDLAAGTVVINEQPVDYRATSDKRGPQQPWEVPVTAQALRSTGLSPSEYRALMSYWMRRDQLTLEARQRILPRLLEPIARRDGHVLPSQDIHALELRLQSLLTEHGQERP